MTASTGLSGYHRRLLVVFLVSLGVRALTALPLQQPGYFDAYFHYVVGENLALGRGLTVDFAWNFLNQPNALTQPSHLYWMPLSSLLASSGMLIAGPTYRSSQLPFIVLSALLPVLAYHLAYRLTRKARHAAVAGALTIASGFYLPFWVSPDNFAPFAVAAGLALLAMGRGVARNGLIEFGAAGVLVGMAHLSRPDGPLLGAALAAVLLVAWRRGWMPQNRKAPATFRRPALAALLALFGYLVVMVPWFYRNWAAIGAPISGAGIQTLFLRTYDDLFSYSRDLSVQSYLAWGVGPILASKLRAAAHNGLVILGGMFFALAPLALWGLWRLRRQRLLLPFLIYAPLLYATMTLIFTFPSMRGSMLHSSAALLPFLNAAVPAGIDAAVAWVAARRTTWNRSVAQGFFSWGAAAMAGVVSLVVFAQGVFILPSDPVAPLWNDRNTIYLETEDWLAAHARPDAAVAVVDPPAFWYFARRPAMAIPNEPLDEVLRVMSILGADYLVVESDRPSGLNLLYEGGADDPRLMKVHVFLDPLGEEVQIYRVAGGLALYGAPDGPGA
ncbi:MAG: glycosyltransferase family 39 protein [Anaerolineae bacterium]